jgi:hypothetical protein
MEPKQSVILACLLMGIVVSHSLAQNYAPAVNYATGKAPVALATGDFNHDGNIDIVVANTGEPSLNLFLGNGDGTFKSAGTISVGAIPVSVAAADFNGDGNLDLAVSLAGSATAQVLFGNGDGTFQAPVTVLVPSLGNTFVGQIAAADLNSDGHPDLLVATSSGLYVFLNDGHGGFAASTSVVGAGLDISSFVIADFNQDGHPDIAWIGSRLSQCGTISATVFLSHGNGDGTFRDPIELPITNFDPGGIAAGDFNRDGRMDIVVSEVTTTVCPLRNSSDGLIQAALQQADGSFVVSSDLTGIVNPGAVIAGDFDGDGNLDIAVLHPSFNSPVSPPSSDAVVIYRGDGSGGFSGPNQFALVAGPRALIAGTFSNTVALDLATADTSANELSVFVNQGASTLALASSSNPAKMHQPVTLTATVQPKFAGDGKPPGSVIFADGDTTLGAATVDASGVAALTMTFEVQGKHSLVAVYGGSGGFVGGPSSKLKQIVNGPPPDVFLQSSPNPSTFGKTVTFTVNVFLPPSGPIPSGTVRLTEGGTVIDTGVLDSTGQARLQLNLLPVGAHTIVAEYAGDSIFGPANSLPLTETVNGSSSTTTVNVTPNPSVFGQIVTLTSSVIAGSGSGIPTGTVAFVDGGTNIGSVAVDGTGNASLQINSLNVGNHSITATYSGDANFQASTSAPSSLTVNASPSTTTLSTAPNPSVFGQVVMLTASVAASGGGGGTPSGAVTFSEGASTLGSVSLDNTGRASLSLNSLTAGSHSITASYSGDGNFLGSSVAASQTVSKSSTTTTMSSAPNPNVYGQAVTLAAVVAASGGGAGTPSGTVTFIEGTAALGTASLDNTGRASLTVNLLPAGSHNLTASYSGDTNLLASTASVSQTVNKSPTATTLTAAPNPSLFGESVAFSITVAAAGGRAGSPSGNVTVLDAGTAIGTAPLDNAGKAVLNIGTLAVGTHNLTANYGGDGNFNASSTSGSGGVTQVVNQSGTVTTLSSSSEPSIFGQTITFTAVVAASGGGAGVPSGTVVFSDGATAIGSEALDNTGKATLTTSSLAVGSHGISANYRGNAGFLASNSTPLSQFVNKDSVMISLFSTPNPSTYGESVTFPLRVSAAPPGGSPGTPLPTGTVTLTEGTSVLATATLDNSGKAAFVIANLTAGSHSIGATYSGDANFSNSILSDHPQEVDKAPTQTILTSSLNPATNASTFLLSARVSSTVGPLSGSVTFLDGTNALASVPLDDSGSAKLPLSNLSIGSHHLTAAYSGDPNFAPSQSVAVNEKIVDSHSTVVLTSSANPQTVTKDVTFVASVTSVLGGVVSGGTVTFSDGPTPLATVPLVNSAASFTTTALAVGDHGITAAYQAGAAPGAFDGISSALVQTIKPASPIVIIGGNKQDFTISIAQPSSDVVAGQTFTTQVTLTPVNGLTGNILTICAGAPSGSTCTVTPDQGTLDGKNSVTATVTVTTTRSGTTAVTAWERTRTPLNGLPRLLRTSLLPFALGMCFCFAGAGERRKRCVFTLALLACLLAGCGGTKLRTQSLAANTPPGSYALTVQSQTGSLAHSSQIVLQVK